MPTNFPTSLDALTNPAPTDDVSVVSHSAQHANANDAIEALQAKVGINSSAVTTSLDYLLKNPASSNPGHTHSVAAITGVLPIAKGGTGGINPLNNNGVVYVDTVSSGLDTNQYFTFQDFHTASGYVNLSLGEATPASGGLGIIESRANTADVPLFYGEINSGITRGQPLFQVYDYILDSDIFRIGPGGDSISLFSPSTTFLQTITCGDGEWLFDMSIRAPQVLGSTQDINANPLVVIGASGQTADLAQFLVVSSVVARIDAAGRIIAGGSTNSSGATLHTSGSFGTRVLSTSTSITAGVGDHTILVNASGAARTITLPTAIGATGRIYVIKKTDSSANAVTVATTSSQTIDGTTTRSLASQYSTITVQSDGANWVRLSFI